MLLSSKLGGRVVRGSVRSVEALCVRRKSTKSSSAIFMSPTASPLTFCCVDPKSPSLQTSEDVQFDDATIGKRFVHHISPSFFPDFTPPPLSWDIPEYSFVGRSNVGKSSLIKVLIETLTKAKVTENQGPRVGKRPGKTKLVHYYGVWDREPQQRLHKLQSSNENRRKGKDDGGGALLPPVDASMYYMIDLPGYGYAGTVSKKARLDWDTASATYLASRVNVNSWLEEGGGGMANVFVLVDSRRGIGKADFEYMDFLDHVKLRHSILLTKLDLLDKLERVRIFNETCRALVERGRKSFSWCRDHVTGVSSKTREGVGSLLSIIETKKELL